MFRFESLEIWKSAISYANELYEIAEKFPEEEKYSLANQLKRAAVSISNNIAEGSGAGTKKNFSSFLDISIRSALETVNILYFAQERSYIKEKERKLMYEKAEILIKRIRALKNTLKSYITICYKLLSIS